MSSIWTSTLIYTFYNFGFGYFSDSSKMKFIKIYIFYIILHKNLTFYKFFKNVQKIFQKFLTFFNYLIVSLLVFSQNGFPQTPKTWNFKVKIYVLLVPKRYRPFSNILKLFTKGGLTLWISISTSFQDLHFGHPPFYRNQVLLKS